MNPADTAWIIVATALVLFMTLPGLALFYGGLVRARNVLSVFMQCYAIACLMSLLWLAAGYSIAFGPSESGIWGGLDKAFLAGVDAESLSGTLPEVLFFAFQMTFAIITPALIVGAYVERINFGFVDDANDSMAIYEAVSRVIEWDETPDEVLAKMHSRFD